MKNALILLAGGLGKRAGFKEPKQFKGGQFNLPQANVTIPMKNNRMIMFPSYYTHSVSPVKMDGEKNQGLGRHTITHFYNWEGSA